MMSSVAISVGRVVLDSILKKEDTSYLTSHSTHYITVISAPNMVKSHIDSKTGRRLQPLSGLLFWVNTKSSFIYTIP